MAQETVFFAGGLLKDLTKDLLVDNQPDVLQATGHVLQLRNNGVSVGIEASVMFNVSWTTVSLANTPVRMPAATSSVQVNEVAVSANGIGVLCVLKFPTVKTLASGDVFVFNSLQLQLNGLNPPYLTTSVLQCLFQTVSWTSRFPDITNNPRLFGVVPRGDFGMAPFTTQNVQFSDGQSQFQLEFGPLGFDFNVQNVSVNAGSSTRLFFNLGAGAFVPSGKKFIVESIKLV